MQVTLLTTTNSRNAGGVFFAVKDLALSLVNCQECNINILSHNDEFSDKDISAYGDISMSFYKISNCAFLNKLGFSTDIHDILKQLNPNIIHQQGIWQYHSFASLKYKKEHSNVKTIITPHGMLDTWAVNRSSFKKRVVGFLYENENLRKADCIHALCRSEYESIREYGLKNPVAIIPNGTTIPTWTRTYENKPQKTMLFLGRIHPKKGIKEFITAINLINQQNPDLLKKWIFKIAGWSQVGHQEELQSLIDRYKLNNLFEFTGSLYGKQKEDALKDADVFVLPSFSEGLPMAVLEAWAYGLPVVMTDFCNLPEGFEANAAFRIDTDSEKMSEQLKTFFELPENEVNNMGRNGYKLVKERFSWDTIAERTVRLYEWLLGGGEKPEFVYE
jgi:poly(glycerol-phosphate) alpha-glucosyltransferase